MGQKTSPSSKLPVSGGQIPQGQNLADMFRQTLYILTIGLFLSCSDLKTGRPDSVTFDTDPREKDISFTPTNGQIENAEDKLINYLTSKTAENQTIFITKLGEKIPLQDELKYYKRRYFGRTSIEGDKIIKIEFVAVRCGGHDEWKKVEYANEITKDCWWSVQYDIDNDQIYDLKL